MTSIQQDEKQHSESPHTTQAFIVAFWGVRYQVKDVQRALTFYTQTLGFNLDMQNLPAFGTHTQQDQPAIKAPPTYGIAIAAEKFVPWTCLSRKISPSVLTTIRN
jgi:hypothetical protein